MGMEMGEGGCGFPWPRNPFGAVRLLHDLTEA